MKYMGSKARLAKQLLPIITANRNNRPYVEPFGGGMNMICEVLFGEGERYAADSNKYLIAMWKALAEGWVPPETVTREFYAECKALEHEAHMIGYVGFNCSYSGKWFGGYAGEVQTQGGLRNYQKEAFRHIMKQIPKLKDVWYCCASYDEIDLPPNSIIYCDPPYEGTTKYKDDFDHNSFWDWVRYVSKQHDVFVSEYNAPEDFEVLWQKPLTSSLSANGKSGGNKNSVERLFKWKG